MHLAAEAGLSWVLERILSLHPSLARAPNGAERRGWSPLHYAAYPVRHGAAVECAKVILDIDRDAHLVDNEDGKTALHAAALSGQATLVRFLLSHGASPRALDKSSGFHPLHWAAWYGYADCVELLLSADKAGVDIPSADEARFDKMIFEVKPEAVDAPPSRRAAIQPLSIILRVSAQHCVMVTWCPLASALAARVDATVVCNVCDRRWPELSSGGPPRRMHQSARGRRRERRR